MTLKHALREQNRVADSLAKQGISDAQNAALQVFKVPPLYALETFKADRLGTYFDRQFRICTTNGHGQNSNLMHHPLNL